MDIGCDINLFFDARHRRTKEEYSKQIKKMCDCGFYNYNFDFWVGADYAPLRQNDYLEWAKDVKAALDENNARVVIGHEPCFFTFEPTDVQKEWYRRMLECVSIIGIEWIVAHPIDIDGEYDKKYVDMLEEKNSKYFSQFIPFLKKYNVGIAIETMLNTFKLRYNGVKKHYGDNPNELISLVDRINCDKIQICLDTGHLHNMGSFHIGDTVRAFGSRLKALHIHDNDGITDQHYLPYMGTIDWQDFIHALRDINYKGYFTYEATKIPEMYPKELRSSWLKLKYDIANYIVNLP